MENREIPQDRAALRAQCMAALLAGSGVAQVAREYKIPVSTASDWRKRAWEQAGRAPEEIGQLLLDFVKEALNTLLIQLEFFRDKEWLRDQTASELGVLFGIQCDKVHRILEAMHPEAVAPREEVFSWDPQEPEENRRLR